MKNRSREFLKKRGALFEKRKTKEKNEVELLFGKISESLSLLESLTSRVEKECALYCIPSFKSKTDVVRRIESLKCEIALNLTKAKGIMDHFSTAYRKSINHVLVESIGVHFHYKIDAILARMNDSLQRIEGSRELLSAEGKSTVESVYKSVFYINTIIKELKAVVISQSDKIERLDTAMEYVSSSAKKSAGEISSIATFGSHAKNRIISVLFFCILVLVALSTMKAYMHSAKARRREKRRREPSIGWTMHEPTERTFSKEAFSKAELSRTRAWGALQARIAQ
ncbi:uncharacterized protein NEMAJ01_2184 [Nematocida major]|uniref:uncharacterized protein n=1 Tax=Nematocida major TaxID=1912982 RepID=UPI002007B49F|nr:uncharacterized protein NEMAJ01_2184 [Nematocida major]KAH9387288.1 hypothetical protein NEMAJ01_2184 [Nematocida major]